MQTAITAIAELLVQIMWSEIHESTEKPLTGKRQLLPGLDLYTVKAYGCALRGVARDRHRQCFYTVGHKKGATFIFTITLANVDRFQ